MTLIKRFLPLIAYFCFNSASALAPAKNIPYQHGHPSQMLDVYYPSASPPYKTVMLIHGGCFQFGAKDSSDSMIFINRLLALGYAVATVNYRLANPNGNFYPAGLLDVEDALCWLEQNGRGLDLDADQVVVMGYSAGASLAMYLGTGHDSGRPHRCTPHVAGVVDFFGRTNFLKNMASPKDSGGYDCSERFIGEKRDDSNPQPEFHAADILTHIDSSPPPILALHGDADAQLDVHNSIDLCSEIPGRCTLKIIHGADHMFTGPGEMEMAFASVAAFLRVRLPNLSQSGTRLAILQH